MFCKSMSESDLHIWLNKLQFSFAACNNVTKSRHIALLKKFAFFKQPCSDRLRKALVFRLSSFPILEPILSFTVVRFYYK